MLGVRTLIPVLAIATFLVAPAEATTTYYVGSANEASFNTAVGGLTLLDPSLTFAAGDLGTGGLFNASGTGINFLGFDDFVFNTPTDLTVNSGKLTATGPGEVLAINFPATGIYGFAFHLTMTSGTNANWCIELTHPTCDYQVFNSAPSSVQFFGVISTTPITAPLFIRNQGGNPTMVLPDFEAFGAGVTDTSVPEPNTLILAGIGLVILRLSRRKTQPA